MKQLLCSTVKLANYEVILTVVANQLASYINSAVDSTGHHGLGVAMSFAKEAPPSSPLNPVIPPTSFNNHTIGSSCEVEISCAVVS